MASTETAELLTDLPKEDSGLAGGVGVPAGATELLTDASLRSLRLVLLAKDGSTPVVPSSGVQ